MNEGDESSSFPVSSIVSDGCIVFVDCGGGAIFGEFGLLQHCDMDIVFYYKIFQFMNFCV